MASYQSDLGTWHYSRIRAYVECHQREALRRAGEPSCSTEAMWRGTHVHEAAARYLRECLERKRTTVPEAGKRIARGYEPDVCTIIEAFVEEVRVPVKADPLYIEQGFTCELPNGEPFAGTLDLAYREAEADANPFAESSDRWTILDWKTHAPAYMDADATPEQCEDYAYLLQQAHADAQNVQVGIGAMQHYGGWRVRFWQVPPDLRPIGERIAAQVDRIMADTELRPNPGPACIGCTYLASCPMRDTAALRAATGDSAEGLLARLLALEAQADELKGLLKAHAAEQGAVYRDGYVYEGRAATSLVPRNLVTLATDLQRFGLTVDGLRNGFSKASIEKAARGLDDAHRDAFLALFDQRHSSTRFAAYKAAQEGEDE